MNQNAKKWIWITVLVVIIIVAAYLLFAKNTGKNNPIQNLVNKQSATENQNKNNTTLSGNANQSGSAMKNNQLSGPVSEEGSPEEKRSSEKPDEAFRQQTIAYVNQNLNKIATPPQNDEWDVPTFYFVGNSIVYLELYPVETDLAGLEILYKVEKDGNGIKLTQLAKKTEGDEDWIKGRER